MVRSLLLVITGAIAIPLCMGFFRIVVNLTGGYRIPLAWTFAFAFAFTIAFVFSFALAIVESPIRGKVLVGFSGIILAIALGCAVGVVMAQAGVLGDELEDPSGGKVSLSDSLSWAVIGSFTGVSIGSGTGSWAKNLQQAGYSANFAVFLSLLTAISSSSAGISFFLDSFNLIFLILSCRASKFNILQPRVLAARLLSKKIKCVTA